MADTTFPPLPPPHTRVGVGGVLLRGGRVFVNRAVYRERFTIPSGFVDPGEPLETALVREFVEEAGVTVRPVELLLSRHKVIDATHSDVYFAYRVELVAGEPKACLPEIVEAREVSIPDALQAPWISSLSRLTIRLAADARGAWLRSPWDGGEVPGRSTEAYHVGP